MSGSGKTTYTMRVLLKLMGIVLVLLPYVFISAVIIMLPVNTKRKRSYAMQTTSFFARPILSVLGIRSHIKHPERLYKKKGCLIISNHLSYADIFILSSLIPSVFVTSVELKNTALLGTIAKCAGSIFVERRKATGLKQEIDDIAVVLKQGFPVVLFPEGTTSNGDRVMQFKKSLFDSAVATRAEVLPLCLRYTRVNNACLTPQNRDAVFYYGGVTFSEHVPRLLSQKSVDVEVMPLKPIKVLAHYSRKDLAAIAHDAISAAYHE
jgi:1-acyl-sn-glycerol-3-phosphate acyltransferase